MRRTEADYILYNGKFYTADEGNPWAEAVAVKDGRFVFVGTTEDVLQQCGMSPQRHEDEAKHGNTTLPPSGDSISGDSAYDKPNSPKYASYDLKGMFVMPGLIDAHTHIGLSVMLGDDDDMPIYDCKSTEEVLAKLREYVKKHPFKPYYAMTFGQAEAVQELHRADIDKIVKLRPAILLEKECHSAWLNTGALKLLGIKEGTPDIAPGYSYYERDEEGKLTGCIKEMTMLPILKLSGNVPKKKMKEGILRISNYLVEHGVTTVFDAGNYFGEENFYKVLAELDREGKLPIHVEGTHVIDLPDMVDGAVAELKRLKSLYERDNIQFKTMKIMFDGTHRIHTAKMLEPYCDADTTGGTIISPERLYDFILELNREKIDLHMHTVGEGAVRIALDCIERAKDHEAKSGHTFDILITLAHLESMSDEDITRFKELGVIADFTPHWHGGNDYAGIANTERLLGKKRANNLMRAKSLADTGATVTFSSDEVSLQLLERWNPFLGMEIGRTRQEVNDGGKDALIFPPESQRLEIADLIKGYTINGAAALRLDDEIGSIEVGKRADMIILDKNLFKINPYEIHAIKPKAVIIKGAKL